MLIKALIQNLSSSDCTTFFYHRYDPPFCPPPLQRRARFTWWKLGGLGPRYIELSL